MDWYGKGLMENEKRYRGSKLEQFQRSQTGLPELRSYWVAKQWLSNQVKAKLNTFFDEIEPRLASLKFSMDLNIIPLTLVYLAWAEEVPDNTKIIKFFRGRSKRDWQRVKKTLNQARVEIEENIVPFFKMKSGWEGAIQRMDAVTKELELLQNHANVFENWWQYFGEGHQRHGKLANRKENDVVMCLVEYFKRKTGSPKYGLVADIFAAAFQKPTDKTSIIRRLKTQLSSDFGLIDADERVDVTHLEAVRETWQHILEESGSWDGPPRPPRPPMPRRLSEQNQESKTERSES
jgi:hypothetical protein